MDPVVASAQRCPPYMRSTVLTPTATGPSGLSLAILFCRSQMARSLWMRSQLKIQRRCWPNSKPSVYPADPASGPLFPDDFLSTLLTNWLSSAAFNRCRQPIVLGRMSDRSQAKPTSRCMLTMPATCTRSMVPVSRSEYCPTVLILAQAAMQKIKRAAICPQVSKSWPK